MLQSAEDMDQKTTADDLVGDHVESDESDEAQLSDAGNESSVKRHSVSSEDLVEKDGIEEDLSYHDAEDQLHSEGVDNPEDFESVTNPVSEQEQTFDNSDKETAYSEGEREPEVC